MNTIEVPALARVEGEGGLYIGLKDGQAVEVRLDIYEPPRFFEGFLVGRYLQDVPDITARICGICPVAYQMSSVAALEKALTLGARHVVVKSDSELVVKQINGLYKIKNAALRPLYVAAVRLIGSLDSFSISYIPRSQNAAADALANQALDGF